MTPFPRFWTLACWILLSAACACADDQRPNILFIYTDDHSYRTISCYPESFRWAQTPNIDELARTGMRFKYAYVGTWCMPSRASLLTGHHQFGVQSMRMVGKYPGSEYDPNQCPFWPKVFRDNGYVTAQIGKWHTGTDTGFGRDWDYQIVWNRPKHTDTAGHYYYDQPVTFQGGETKLIKEYSTDKYTEWAGNFIRGDGRDTDKPWYLWLCYGAVHGPYTPAERHLHDYESIRVPVPSDIFPPRAGKPNWMQQVNFWSPGSTGEPMHRDRTLTSWVQQYHQAVRAIDEGVGKLLAALEETGQRENTLIVFTADQGFAWGQHGFRHKVAAYDSNIRAPMIVSLPGTVPTGTVVDTPVGGIDLIPTFFKFADIQIPWKMHGHDLSPILHDPNASWPHAVMLTHTGRSYGDDTDEIPTDWGTFSGGIPWYVMLRQGRYKYVRSMVEGAVEELYDLANDPDELTNMAIADQYQAQLQQFRDQAVQELRRTGAGFLDQLPEVGER